jgi:RHS repeat-associated protein
LTSLKSTSVCKGGWASGNRTIEYEHDDNGSLVSKTTSLSSDPNTIFETVTYDYNLQNRLEWVTREYVEDGNDIDEVTEYTYNPDGIRVRSYYYKTINGGGPEDEETKTFLIDAYNHTGYAQVLEEWSGGANPDITYTIGDDVITQYSSTSGAEHLLYDGHGSTRQLIDNSEDITAAFSYDAYGFMLGGNPTRSSPAGSSLLYAGEQYDNDMQQYYLRARYYDPLNGRFNRMDPFAGSNHDPQSLHKYLYVHCNPVNNVDPSGKFALCDIVIAAGIIGLALGLILPAETVGERITNALMMGLVFALITDLALVVASAVALTLCSWLGIPLLSGEAYLTLSMIVVGGTTFAGGTEKSFFVRQINQINRLWPWGHKTPTEQPLKVKLSRQVSENAVYEKRLNRAFNKGQPRVTTIDRSGSIANRRVATKSLPTKENFHRDEWPMAFTREGGAGSDLEYMDPHVNTSVGARVGDKLRPYSDGTKFEIEFHNGPP